MIDAHVQQLLQDLLRRESRSVLMYVAEAYPWTTANETKTRNELQQLIAEERQALTALGRFLVRQRVPLPYLAQFPMLFTTINFVSLDYLFPRLLEHQQRSIRELERALSEVKAPAARAEVEKLLTLKRRQLARLEELASPQPLASVS